MPAPTGHVSFPGPGNPYPLSTRISWLNLLWLRCWESLRIPGIEIYVCGPQLPPGGLVASSEDLPGCRAPYWHLGSRASLQGPGSPGDQEQAGPGVIRTEKTPLLSDLSEGQV